MAQQTAVEWLVQYVNSEEYQKAFGQTYISVVIIEQAKAMEKEQTLSLIRFMRIMVEMRERYKIKFQKAK